MSPDVRIAAVRSFAGRWARRLTFGSSGAYWDRRYRSGGTSGSGSFGRLAEHKARFLNQLVRAEAIGTVVEFGCGDGNQLARLDLPRDLGLDVSPAAIRLCEQRFREDATKSFLLYAPDSFHDSAGFIRGELSMSIDVLYHLVEQSVWEAHLLHLFAASTRIVVVYAADQPDARTAAHVRLRPFTPWVATNLPMWSLDHVEPNPYPFDPDQPDETTFASFHVYRRTG